ncbi:sensor histidine kinase [Thermomonospora umbrina]|uniref:sensor histidine kinase n=1 Tax=Thermomonospora umbrina TaxID=111806 RepID=UPI001FE7FD8B|nr:sensor histidine kinase [Thermomonospora umbrina]
MGARIGESWRAAWRGLGLSLLSLVVGVAVFCSVVTGISLLMAGIGILVVPMVMLWMRRFTDLHRRLVTEWTGVRIDSPYSPERRPSPGPRGWWKTGTRALSDRATWRDLLWLLINPVAGGALALLPAAMIWNGVFGIMLAAGLWLPTTETGDIQWYMFVPVSSWGTAWAAGVVGSMSAIMGLHVAKPLLLTYGRWCRLLLAPTRKAQLAMRVRHLTETRSDAVGAQASELRRIERDLHDGAQARLVAMGMTLGAIEHLLDRDPEKARLLLAEARSNSAKALGELRDLVRGIHPPVLADRGLVDAVRALALDHPMPVEVSSELTERLEAPVETAAYFAVAEILTNAAKHSGARRVWVDVRHERDVLRISVTDDGRGGADPAAGGGLRGVERRVGTFDGVLAVTSPPGGPTIVTLEVPCALSSPRTSPC